MSAPTVDNVAKAIGAVVKQVDTLRTSLASTAQQVSTDLGPNATDATVAAQGDTNAAS